MNYPDYERLGLHGIGGGAPDPTRSCSQDFMQSEAFLSFLNKDGGGAYRKDADGVNNGYPVLTIAPQYKSPAITVVVNGALLEFSELPIVERGRVLVPAWPLGYALDVNVSGFEGYIGFRPYPLEVAEPQLAMQVGSRIMTWGDERILLDVVPRRFSFREYVPLRAVVETLGGSVEWEQETHTVYITYEFR